MGHLGGVFIDAQGFEDKDEALSIVLPPVECSGCTFECLVYYWTNGPSVYNQMFVLYNSNIHANGMIVHPIGNTN